MPLPAVKAWCHGGCVLSRHLHPGGRLRPIYNCGEVPSDQLRRPAVPSLVRRCLPPPPPCLQDGHKKLRKNWKWFDGFVTQSGRDAKLYNEGGSLVATACLSLGEALEEGGEVARSFGASVVVAVDAPCTPADIYGDGGGGGAAAPAALPPSPAGGAGGGAGPTAAVAAKPRMVGAALRGVGSGSKRPTFKAPRPLPAAAPPAHMAAAAASAPAPCVQPERRPFLAPARRAPAAQLPLAVAAQPSVLPSGAPTFRSGAGGAAGD